MCDEIVSVVMSTYERNDILFTRSLPSVQRQTHEKLNINVVCDGMRGDSLIDLQTRVEGLKDPRVRLWLIPRQTYPEDPQEKWCVLGLNARNHGLDQATAKWVAPLDDDDEWTDDHVEALLTVAKGKDVDFVYGMSKYHWPDEREQMAGRWPPGMGSFCDGAQIYRHDMGYRYDPGCIERGLPEDGDLWDRMVKGGVSFAFAPTLVHHYYPNER